MSILNNLPKFEVPLAQGRVTDKGWYFFWQGLFTGLAPAREIPVKPTPTPFTYQAPQRGFLIVNGGTVALVQWSRDGITNYTTGATAGCFPLSAADRLIITYTVAPTLTFVPQ